MADRPYDVVVFGATGFAGRLTAEYLAQNAPSGCRWAIAGRSEAKLAGVRDGLAAAHPELNDLPLVVADVGDDDSLRALAESTRVLITTVGPYALYGEGVVAACAAAGTDYLDLTGEPEFFARTYVRHHETAVESGARLVHAAGFDSIPHDLGALFTVQHLPADVPIKIAGYVRADAGFSGGTFASLLTGMSRPRKNLVALRELRAAEPPTSAGRRVHTGPGRPGRDPIDGEWAMPFPGLDALIIERSARSVDRYGPDFRYAHHMCWPRLRTVAGIAGGLVVVAGAAQIPPARRALQRRLEPGEGPSPEKRARSWFRVTFVGEGGGERVVTRVAGGDPGYTETAKMLAESALCLAFDDLPQTAGQVSTATAMGDALIDRLRKAGIDFEVLA